MLPTSTSLGRIGLKGPLAWLAHRGYHGMAMPTVERKIRVIFGWILAFFLGRDTTQLMDLDNPRGAFVAAATPAPKPAAAPGRPGCRASRQPDAGTPRQTPRKLFRPTPSSPSSSLRRRPFPSGGAAAVSSLAGSRRGAGSGPGAAARA